MSQPLQPPPMALHPQLPPPTLFEIEKGSFKFFRKRTENIFKTYFASDDATRKAYFLACLGDQTYSLLQSLCVPHDPEDDTKFSYTDLADKLSKHLSPVRSIFSSRQAFYSSQQMENETVADYSARIRSQATACDFGTVLDVVLRDIFVIGLRHEKVKERLYEEDPTDPSFTLMKAIQVASSKEAAGKRSLSTDFQRLEIKSERSDLAFIRSRGRKPFKVTHPTNSDSYSVRRNKCSHCGWKHDSRTCRFKTASCDKCKIVGHLASICPSRKKNKSTKSRHNYVDTDKSDSEEICLSETFFSIQDERDADPGLPITIPIRIAGSQISFELDTGSKYNVISEKFFAENFRRFPVSPNDVHLKDYVGHPIQPVGKVILPVEHPTYTGDMVFYIIKKGGPPLIGRNGFYLLKNTNNSSNLFQNSEIRFPSADPDIKKILMEFPKVFSTDTGIFSKHQVRLNLVNNAEPRFLRARTLPIALQHRVEAELVRLMAADIIEPVDHSPWATPIVPILKPDGTVRICGDYRLTLNPVLEATGNSLPKIDHLCANFANARIFSKIDLRDAYQQMELDNQSRVCTTINTHLGLFRYKRLCFGLSCAPSIFQRAMDNLLRGIDGVGCLLDDIHITGRDVGEHNRRLRQVLKILDDANLRAKGEKCVFGKSSMRYLGHIIDATGIRPTDQHVTAIRDAPRPSDSTSLKSFLGMITFFIKFVPNAARILQPLYALLKKDTKWIWTTKCQQAFSRIKKILTSVPVLAHYDPKMPLKLSVDASAKAVGAVLMHKYPDGDRPIAYASQLLSDTQQKYASIEREAYAIIFGVTKFRDFLFGQKFDLITDHRPLLYIFGSKKGLPVYAANRVQRWAYMMSNFDYNIRCVRSKDNCADYLSRIDWPRTTQADTADEINYFNFINENCPFRVNWKTIRRTTRTDPVLSVVYSRILTGQKMPNDEKFLPFTRRQEQLTVEKDCLMWGYRVIVPEKLRKAVLRELHSSHLGSSKMKSLARSYFWWPSLDLDIEREANECQTCCQYRNVPSKSIIHPWPVPSRVWTRVHVDYLGPIKNIGYGFVIMDATSRWIENFFVPSATAENAIEKLEETFARFGLPRAVTTDGARCFTGEEFTSFLDRLGIIHLYGAPFHPQTNGAAESAVKIIKRCIQKNASNSSRTLKRVVQQYLLHHRNTVHAATGETPASMMLKQRPKILFDSMIPSTDDITFGRQIQVVQGGGKRNIHLNTGQEVWARDFRDSKTKWTPGRVVSKLGNQTYVIKTREEDRLWKRHINQLWPSIPNKSTTTNLPSEPDVLQPESENAKDDSIPQMDIQPENDPTTDDPAEPAPEAEPSTLANDQPPNQTKCGRKVRKPLRYSPDLTK
ncbi:Hypothetical Protein NTJ_11689 [Nesidiocoris tenuis]|uniref:RNA-directed DNA polymerase n=1 Tax=Nesidiocoris tenuis TaxID=355587 RepID=A0ABN7B3P4_9HEMI|nr:Hypothetical Protein NTJ_11689 [Nesidiocoris tenuis]